MKKFSIKLILPISLFILFSCTQMRTSGKWENNIKDANGASITTSLTINETGDSFTGNMSSVVEGNASDKIKSSLKNIDFSGYSTGTILVITNINNSSDPYFTKSTLALSEEGNKLTLAPGGLVFVKK